MDEILPDTSGDFVQDAVTDDGQDATKRASQLPLVLVVMACYNGARFLDEQLTSLFAQQSVQVKLLVRDDGSNDGTQEKLVQWQQKRPDQIQVIDDDAGNLGAAGSFSVLLTLALQMWQGNDRISAVALADQDDIWFSNKLSESLKLLDQGCQGKDDGLPVLVHSDLRVVDQDMQEMAPSLMQYQGLDASKTQFASQLLSNTVTGCTAVCNKALLQLALPIPAQAMMHDWWLSLVASAFGEIRYIDRPLMEYRQHGRNTLGARLHPKLSVQRIGQVLIGDESQQQADQAQQLFVDSAAQAAAFRSRFADKLDEKMHIALKRAERMPTYGRWRQRLMFRWQRWFA
jgi:hypothetical protein